MAIDALKSGWCWDKAFQQPILRIASSVMAARIRIVLRDWPIGGVITA